MGRRKGSKNKPGGKKPGPKPKGNTVRLLRQEEAERAATFRWMSPEQRREDTAKRARVDLGDDDLRIDVGDDDARIHVAYDHVETGVSCEARSVDASAGGIAAACHISVGGESSGGGKAPADGRRTRTRKSSAGAGPESSSEKLRDSRRAAGIGGAGAGGRAGAQGAEPRERQERRIRAGVPTRRGDSTDDQDDGHRLSPTMKALVTTIKDNIDANIIHRCGKVMAPEGGTGRFPYDSCMISPRPSSANSGSVTSNSQAGEEKCVIAWVPEYLWPGLAVPGIPCPRCGTKGSSDGWIAKPPRRVYMEHDVAYLIGFRYRCSRCVEHNRTNKSDPRPTTFNAWDPGCLERLPEYVRKEFPYLLTHRSGIEIRLANRLAENLMQEQQGSSTVSRKVTNRLWLNYSKYQASMNAAEIDPTPPEASHSQRTIAEGGRSEPPEATRPAVVPLLTPAPLRSPMGDPSPESNRTGAMIATAAVVVHRERTGMPSECSLGEGEVDGPRVPPAGGVRAGSGILPRTRAGAGSWAPPEGWVEATSWARSKEAAAPGSDTRSEGVVEEGSSEQLVGGSVARSGAPVQGGAEGAPVRSSHRGAAEASRTAPVTGGGVESAAMLGGGT